MNMKLADAKREEGFTLIELLVVVIIIGILAAIAIPIFLNQRTQARVAAVESTLRSAATYQEIYYTEDVDYTTDPGDLETIGFRSGTNVTVVTPIAVAAESYCIEAFHAQDNDVRGYIDSSIAGGGNPVVDDTGTETC